MTDDVTPPTGDNAAFFFDRFPSGAARWLAGLCDEANAKVADGSSFEFRRIVCDLLTMSVRDGIPHALSTLEHLIAPPNPSIKYIEERYWKYDQARSAVIDTSTGQGGSTGQTTGAGTADGTTGTEPPTTGGTAPGDTTGPTPTGASTTTVGGGKTGGTGTTTVGPGCGGGWSTGPGTADNTGIGEQGTLFIVHWGEFRASVPARRKKYRAENKRLIDVRRAADRQIAANDEIDAILDRVEKADEVLENLIGMHRNESSLSGVLRAAGKTPADLGLTDSAVAWLDSELKAM